MTLAQCTTTEERIAYFRQFGESFMVENIRLVEQVMRNFSKELEDLRTRPGAQFEDHQDLLAVCEDYGIQIELIVGEE